MLKTYQLSPEGSSKNEEIELSSETLRVCYSCKYSIDVKRNAGFSLRTYVWSGGMETVNGQATEWCFAYGEADWLAGVKFSDIQAKATQFNDLGNINSNYDKTLRINCN